MAPRLRSTARSTPPPLLQLGAGTLALLSPGGLPFGPVGVRPGRAELVSSMDAVCEAGAEQGFNRIAVENEGDPLITEYGCGTAAAMSVCHIHAAGGLCTGDLECEGLDTAVDASCVRAGSTDGNSCCVKLYRRPCGACAPEVFSCGVFCSDTPGGDPFKFDSADAPGADGSSDGDSDDSADMPSDGDAAAEAPASAVQEAAASAAGPREGVGVACVAVAASMWSYTYLAV